MTFKTGYISLVVLLLAIGMYSCGRNSVEPQIETLTETVYRDREIRIRDTVRVVEPHTEIQYKTIEVEKLRIDTVLVPVGFQHAGLVSATPITRKGQSLVLTTFDLNKQAFTQRRYEVPERRLLWSVMPSVSHESAALSVNLTLNRIGLQVSTIQTFSGRYLYHAGIGYKFSS